MFFFHVHLFRKRLSNHMAAVRLQVILSSYAKYSKNNLFISGNTYKLRMLSNQNCNTGHEDNMCFLPNCTCRIFFWGNVEELIQKLDPLCFTYQHLDCLHTLFKYQFSGNIVLKSAQDFDNV